MEKECSKYICYQTFSNQLQKLFICQQLPEIFILKTALWSKKGVTAKFIQLHCWSWSCSTTKRSGLIKSWSVIFMLPSPKTWFLVLVQATQCNSQSEYTQHYQTLCLWLCNLWSVSGVTFLHIITKWESFLLKELMWLIRYTTDLCFCLQMSSRDNSDVL